MRYFVTLLLLVAPSFGQTLLSGVLTANGGQAGIVATPTDSPGAGTYTSTQSVTLSDATAGSTICYTTDGSTPGASTPGTCNGSPTQTYSTAISVSATTTIKAIGTKSGLANSGVLSSTYTIIPPISQVQKTTTGACSNTTGTTLGCSLPGNVTSGNLIIAAYFAVDSAANTSVSGSLNTGTWSTCGTNTLSFAARNFGFAYKISTGTGAETVTLTTATSGVRRTLQLFEYTGIISSPCDQIATSSNSTSSTSLSCGPTGTLSKANELALMVGAVPGSDGSYTQGAGWTMQTSDIYMGTEHQIVSSTSALTGTMTTTPSETWNCVLATFKGN